MNLVEIRNQKILFACNDWGMGHIMRSIPIINKLQKQKNEIIFAGSDFQREIIFSYFPSIETIKYNGQPFTFKGDQKWNLEILRNLKNLLKGIKSDLAFVKKTSDYKKITLIISDHRYGFRHPKTPSIFITHQVTLPLKRIQQMANYWHSNQLKKYNAIWVLDDENHSYAGKLSTPTIKLPIYYLGIQSRFERTETDKQDFILAVISGPEPYAEQLFHQVIDFAKQSNETIKCISPKGYNTEIILPNNLELINHLSWKEKDELFYQCKSIISRTGYTTIMDLAVLQKPALLIPTPGQGEQEYLYLLHKHYQNI
jgi:uncharacterized protein (TIGR00661 family)